MELGEAGRERRDEVDVGVLQLVHAAQHLGHVAGALPPRQLAQLTQHGLDRRCAQLRVDQPSDVLRRVSGGGGMSVKFARLPEQIQRAVIACTVPERFLPCSQARSGGNTTQDGKEQSVTK